MKKLWISAICTLSSVSMLSFTPLHGQVPALKDPIAVLRTSSPIKNGFPLLPRNNYAYTSGEYEWKLFEGVSLGVTVYRLSSAAKQEDSSPDEIAAALSNVADPSELCSQAELQYGFEDRQIFVVAEGEFWFLFSFPNRNLPVCSFIDGFLTVYLFFSRVGGEDQYANFPAIIGSLPES